MDFRDLVDSGYNYWHELKRVKQRIAPPDFPWYPYDSLGNLVHLDPALKGEYRDLLRLAGEDPILDIGCADGDMSFFLETLGRRVVAVDNPVTHHNHMRGARLLKEHLKSSVELCELDIDEQFALPGGRYGLAFFMGILYHLKNPFHALETLSKRARYCVLSTRVARLLADRKTRVEQAPVAYLVSAEELNGDDSNYWIFSESGLRRLLQRTNWEVLSYVSVGASKDSDPVSEADERAYCLLLSHYGLWHAQLLEGWYEQEPGKPWRWAAPRFSAILPRRDPAATCVKLFFYLHDSLFEGYSSVALDARVNGVPAPRAVYYAPGQYRFFAQLPEHAGDAVKVEFAFDHGIPEGRFDERDLGVTVGEMEIE